MTKTDILEYFEDSLIQHGKENDRVYLMKLAQDQPDAVIYYIESLACENKYTKIFTKIPVSRKEAFIKRGYLQESFIPKFFKGEEDCSFLVKYPVESRKRHILNNKDEIESIISTSLAKKAKNNKINLAEKFIFEQLTPDEAQEIASLYAKVFKTYPFPIFDPKYILKTMDENVIYFGIKTQGKLIALSSAEIDNEGLNAEMTDFATDPEYRGNNFSLILLQKMEEKMQQLDIKTVYTIARSLSCGMNITFAKNNYEFGGTLINNTNIYGNIESMNVWYKNI